MMNLSTIKISKDMIMLGVGLGCTIVGSIVNSYKQEQQAQKIADMVVKQMKGGNSHK